MIYPPLNIRKTNNFVGRFLGSRVYSKSTVQALRTMHTTKQINIKQKNVVRTKEELDYPNSIFRELEMVTNL